MKKTCLETSQLYLVAAGPSLEDEFENLRRIKEEGSAYIFTVGSAIKALINQGIKPHAACTMDPGEATQLTFAEIIEKNITDVPHIYGTSVGFETVRAYPGPQLFMVMDKDKVTPFFLKNDNDAPLGIVNDAPSIAITTLQTLSLLGFNPVILVGQNLGFRNSQTYAKGIAYEALDIQPKRDHMTTASELATSLTTEDVYGQEMQTNRTYRLFKKTIEYMISKFPDTTYINTTRGGAAIKGAPFSELDVLMSKQLKRHVVDEQWINKIKPGAYDIKYLLLRKKRMTSSLQFLKRSLDEMGSILDDIKKHISFRNHRQLNADFMRMDKTFTGITRNDFYRTFISPLNILETAIFGNGMAQVHAEILHAERAEHVVRNFGLYIRQCKHDVTYITDVLYPYITSNIDYFQEWSRNQDASAAVEPAVPTIDGSYMQLDKEFL